MDKETDANKFVSDILISRDQHRSRSSELIRFGSLFLGTLMVGYGYLAGRPNVTLNCTTIIAFLLSFFSFLLTAGISIISWHISFAEIRWPSKERLLKANYDKYTKENYVKIYNSLLTVSCFVKIASVLFCLGLFFLAISLSLVILN